MFEWIDRRAAPLMLAFAAAVGAVLAGFSIGDGIAEQANLAARWTARAALPFFLFAFSARALARLWPSALTRGVLRRRRQWGLGFALAHFIHLGALWFNITVAAPLALRLSASEAVANNLGGIVIFLFITAMAATSNDASVRWLGRWWGRLHIVGLYSIWLAFTLAYAGRIVQDDPGMRSTGLIFTPLLVGALLLRLWARWGTARVIH